MKYALSILLLACLASAVPGRAQKSSISGYVLDASTKEALIGANVYAPTLHIGSTANEYGYYSLSLPTSDSVKIVVSYVGYAPETQLVVLKNNTRIDFHLTSSTMLNEVEVSATRNDDNVNKSQMGVIAVPMKDIKSIPVLMGERDILKAIQFLPGVQQAQEGTTGFFVRGGKTDQNLVLLDEATVYNPNHLFGLVSTFNINSINNVQLVKGGFPAWYGGRLSSILGITMKDGNKEKYQVEGGLGILSTNLTVQGPLIRKKASFIISGRRSYLDLLEKAFLPSSTTLYSFYDLNIKLNFELGKNDKIYVSAFRGRDNGSYTGSNSLSYGIGFGNSTATVRWNHLFGSKLFANNSMIINNYDMGLNTTQGSYYSQLFTGINDINGKSDFTWMPASNHAVRFGANYFYHTLFPATFSSRIPRKGNRVVIDKNAIPKKYSHEAALYVNHEWDISSNVGISYGVRVPYYFSYGKTYLLLEPRVTVKTNLTPSSSIKASYTAMNQFLHAVPYSSASLPTDIWISSSPLVKPQHSDQISLGFFKNLKDNQYELSVEGYYKQMRNQVLFKQGTQLLLNTNIEDQLTFGNGKSYGVEFFAKKGVGRFSGWLSYTLSKTDQKFPELNFGQTFPFTYDRRHNLALVATYELNERWTATADFVFRTGNAYTLPPGLIPVIDGTLYDSRYYDYTTRNNARLRPYHRLDLSFTHKRLRRIFGKTYQGELVLGVYNMYSRQNPYFVYLTIDPATQRAKAIQVSLFPALPIVGYNFKF